MLLSCLAYAQQDTLAVVSGESALSRDSAVSSEEPAPAAIKAICPARPDTVVEVVAGSLYVDTMQVEALTGKADDQYLLDIIAMQTAQRMAAADSVHQWLLKNDTTDVLRAHLGYADSLKIAKRTKEGYASPFVLPILYHPQEKIPFKELRYEYAEEVAPLIALPAIRKNVRKETRHYITTRAAALYAGTLDTTLLEEVPTSSEESKSLFELYIPEKSLIQDTEADRKQRLAAIKNKNNPWFKELNTMLMFTQNYTSKNWHEGGNSALAMYTNIKGKIIYDDKKRINWESTAEWVAGFSTVQGDSLRKVNTTDDLFRLYTKLGFKVAQKLYISASAEYRSQVFPTYNANQTTIKTGFCTPIRMNIALGVDYKPVKSLSMVVSPLAYKMVYANDTARSNYTSYGIAEGENVLNQLGSSVRLEWKWKPLREIQLETNFYLYTNYKAVELDLELNCDFIINRFMSARVILHPRYDSARILEGDDKAKLQFKELISIGFAHKFY